MTLCQGPPFLVYTTVSNGENYCDGGRRARDLYPGIMYLAPTQKSETPHAGTHRALRPRSGKPSPLGMCVDMSICKYVYIYVYMRVCMYIYICMYMCASYILLLKVAGSETTKHSSKSPQAKGSPKHHTPPASYVEPYRNLGY